MKTVIIQPTAIGDGVSGLDVGDRVWLLFLSSLSNEKNCCCIFFEPKAKR
jgi:hypothetical protein